MKIVPASDIDRASMLSLSKQQMEHYLEQQSLTWDCEERKELLDKSELFRIEHYSLIGYVQLFQEGAELFIYDLQLYPDFHGKGFGTKIIGWVKDQAKGRGLSSVRLGSFKANPACKLYEKMGFGSFKQNEYFTWYKHTIT